KIVCQEFHWISVVRENSTNAPCRHHHYIRPGRREIVFCGLLMRKIKLAVARKRHLARLLSETADDSGTCHPAMAGYEDALASQIERSRWTAYHSTPPTPAYTKFRRQEF